MVSSEKLIKLFIGRDRLQPEQISDCLLAFRDLAHISVVEDVGGKWETVKGT